MNNRLMQHAYMTTLGVGHVLTSTYHTPRNKHSQNIELLRSAIEKASKPIQDSSTMSIRHILARRRQWVNQTRYDTLRPTQACRCRREPREQ